MKKIAGILAAAAVLATSVFAADVSAGVRLEGSLFNFDGASESIEAIKITSNNQDYHKPVSFSISSDVAGATFRFSDLDPNYGLKATNHTIWFKPVEMLTVKLGNIGEAMNTETIGWWRRVLNYDSFGYEAIVETNGVKVALGLVPGDNSPLISKAKDADISVGEVNLFGSYSADFGTISAMFDFTNTFKTIKIAAGYKNTFDPVTFFVDVMFCADTDASVNSMKADADVKFAKDAFGAEAYVQASFNDLADISKDTMKVWLVAKATYAIDGGTIGLEIEDGNLLADTFGMSIYPSFTGSVGIMSYEIGAKFNIAEKISVGIPVNFAVAF